MTYNDFIPTLERCTKERGELRSSLKDLSECLLESTGWVEQPRLAQALLWSLHTLQAQNQLHFSPPPSPGSSLQEPQS